MMKNKANKIYCPELDVKPNADGICVHCVAERWANEMMPVSFQISRRNAELLLVGLRDMYDTLKLERGDKDYLAALKTVVDAVKYYDVMQKYLARTKTK